MTLKKKFLIAIFFCAALFLMADEEIQESLKIILEFSPDAVRQNEPFTLNIVVNHPNPDEVNVETPDFHDVFRMERLRTETRLILNSRRDGERWTVFEFLLTAATAGVHELGVFEVSVFDKKVFTNPIMVNIQEEKEKSQTALEWFGKNGRDRVPRSTVLGDSREAVLRVMNWEKNKAHPPTLPMTIEAPQNAIIERIPLSKNEIDSGIILRLRIVPLTEQTIIINKQILRHENLSLEIPSLSINVLPAAVTGKSTKIETASGETVIDERDTGQLDAAKQPVSFQALMSDNENIFQIFKVGVDDCLKKAEYFWEQGKYADALAVLRHGERVLSAAHAVRTARIVCENYLDLPPSPKERWIPRTPLFFILIFSASAFSALILLRKRLHISFFSSILFICIFISALSALLFSYSGEKKNVVVSQCFAYPIPEENIESSMTFMEGEPVRILTTSDSWVYAESRVMNVFDKSGWIKKEHIVLQ
jgi:hypothetical protein